MCIRDSVKTPWYKENNFCYLGSLKTHSHSTISLSQSSKTPKNPRNNVSFLVFINLTCRTPYCIICVFVICFLSFLRNIISFGGSFPFPKPSVSISSCFCQEILISYCFHFNGTHSSRILFLSLLVAAYLRSKMLFLASSEMYFLWVSYSCWYRKKKIWNMAKLPAIH